MLLKANFMLIFPPATRDAGAFDPTEIGTLIAVTAANEVYGYSD